jgi:hypothetical protein
MNESLEDMTQGAEASAARQVEVVALLHAMVFPLRLWSQVVLSDVLVCGLCGDSGPSFGPIEHKHSCLLARYRALYPATRCSCIPYEVGSSGPTHDERCPVHGALYPEEGR